jgi:hypothetical protein
MIVRGMAKSKFILRFCGEGAKPPADVKRIKQCEGVTVIDQSTPRMLLVEGPKAQVRKLADSMPDWALSEERRNALPKPRPRVRRAA